MPCPRRARCGQDARIRVLPTHLILSSFVAPTDNRCGDDGITLDRMTCGAEKMISNFLSGILLSLLSPHGAFAAVVGLVVAYRARRHAPALRPLSSFIHDKFTTAVINAMTGLCVHSRQRRLEQGQAEKGGGEGSTQGREEALSSEARGGRCSRGTWHALNMRAVVVGRDATR